jgi:hypothetical protein
MIIALISFRRVGSATHIGDNNPVIILDADGQPQRGFVDSLLDRWPPGWRSVWRDREATALAMRRA